METETIVQIMMDRDRIGTRRTWRGTDRRKTIKQIIDKRLDTAMSSAMALIKVFLIELTRRSHASVRDGFLKKKKGYNSNYGIGSPFVPL